MSAPHEPGELYRHGLQAAGGEEPLRLVELRAEGGVLEFAFAPPGWPRGLGGGQEVGASLRRYPEHIDRHDVPEPQSHRTTDPETLVVERRAVA